jgi:hypothetical protein
MPAGDLITADYQCEYAGILMGPGTKYGIKSYDFADMPVLRSSHTSRGNDQGNYRGSDYMDNRFVNLDMVIIGTSNNDLQNLIATLQGATAPSNNLNNVLVFQLPGQVKKQVSARSYKRAMPQTADRAQFATVDAKLQFLCLDPRIYSQALNVSSVGPPAIVGGRVWPHVYPRIYTSGTGSSVIVCNNVGTFETRPVYTIVGPVTNPAIFNNTTGQYLKFNITLLATDTLTIDTAASSVLLNGTASRRNSVTTDSSTITSMNLQPGANSIGFLPTSSVAGALLTVTWRDAWV